MRGSGRGGVVLVNCANEHASAEMDMIMTHVVLVCLVMMWWLLYMYSSYNYLF